MAQSTIQYDVFVNVGDVKLKFHTKDGGKHLQFIEIAQLPADISKEAVERVLGKVLNTFRAETVRIETARVEAAERRRIAREEERVRTDARMKKEALEQERQIRRQDFLAAKNRKLAVPFDAAMFATPSEAHALKVAVNNPKLTFAGYFESSEYIDGAGHVTQKNFAFLDPDKLGSKVCPECGHATVHTTISHSSGNIHKVCHSGSCKFFSNELPQPRRGAALIGFQASAGAKI
jgi:hypothetical protein